MAGGVRGRRNVHGRRGDMHSRGTFVAGGMRGLGVHGRGGACVECTHPTGRYYEIWSMSGWYAFYWNAFLFTFVLRCRELEFRLSFLEHYEERKSDQIHTREGSWVGCVLNIDYRNRKISNIITYINE